MVTQVVLFVQGVDNNGRAHRSVYLRELVTSEASKCMVPTMGGGYMTIGSGNGPCNWPGGGRTGATGARVPTWMHGILEQGQGQMSEGWGWWYWKSRHILLQMEVEEQVLLWPEEESVG